MMRLDRMLLTVIAMLASASGVQALDVPIVLTEASRAGS